MKVLSVDNAMEMMLAHNKLATKSPTHCRIQRNDRRFAFIIASGGTISARFKFSFDHKECFYALLPQSPGPRIRD